MAISNLTVMAQEGDLVAVWHYGRQTWVFSVAYPQDKRVRVDEANMYDLAVFRVNYDEATDSITLADHEELLDWSIQWS